MIIEGKIELVTSFMLHYENGRKPNEEQKNKIERFFKTYRKIHVGVENAEVLEEKIIEIMKTGVKRRDATHIASSIFTNCDYFVTVDDRLLRYKSNEIEIVNPVYLAKKLEVNPNE